MTMTRARPFLMWFFPLLFFAYQFILRLWPGLMMPKIMEQFSINASHFGLLAAFYYFGYAGMQIPIAALLDRFSSRAILFIFAVMCGLATLVFTYTDNFYLALFTRFLVGVGSAAGFLSVSKVVSEWFPAKKYATMIGLSFTFGLMGAIYGDKPVSLLIDTYGGRNVATILAIVAIIIGLASYFSLRSPRNKKTLAQKESFKIANFKFLFSSPVIWYLALANLLMVGSLEGFSDVWGVPYLTATYHLAKGDAAGFISFVFVGMLLGGPLLALLSKKLGTYTIIAACGMGLMLAFILLLWGNHYNSLFLYGLFFAIGVLCCYQVIVFAAGSELVAPQNLGVTVAFLNSINMLGGSFFHTTIGKAMDLFWTGTLDNNNLRVYDPQVYKYALSIIPLCALIGAVIICLVGSKKKQAIQIPVEG